MKNHIASLAVLVILLVSCKKSNDVVPAQAKTPVAVDNSSKPSSAFFINNTVAKGTVMEGDYVDFRNTSINADSYYWDFGDGTYSTEKVPGNVLLSPCGATLIVTLTVKNKIGIASIYSEPVYVRCSGKHATGE